MRPKKPREEGWKFYSASVYNSLERRMCKNISLLIIVLFSLFFFVYSASFKEKIESGTISIFFMDEKVGYEEYTWQSDELGYILTVKGRMTKPVAMEIEHLTIRLDESFIPAKFVFKGSVNGVTQEVSSSIIEGHVENRILAAGQEQKSSVSVKRDAFLLPNPIFSPYMVLTKKFRCTLKEKVDLSAYIIPQLETPFTLEPKEDDSCFLIMQINGIQINIETDGNGNLKSLHIPFQNLRVIQDNR